MIRAVTLPMVILSALLCLAAATGADTGTVLKNTEIKAEPFRDAKVLATIKTGDKVEILKRVGGWFQIKRGNLDGWVRMLSIRRGEARKRAVAADDVLALASGRAGTGQVVATTGIRGLSEEELKTAKFTDAEVKKMESLKIAPEEAQKYAEAGKLAPQAVKHLRNPD